MPSDITIIIKTFERPQHLQRCVDSIRTYYSDIHVMVGDDSKEPTPIKGVEYYKLPYDIGMSAGRNYLIRQVKTPYFLLTDDDMIFTQDTNVELMKQLLITGKFNILGCEVLEGNNKLGCVFNLEKTKDEVRYVPVTYKHPFIRVDLIPNFFIAKTKNAPLFDEHLKHTEHFDYYYRNKSLVGYTEQASVQHQPLRDTQTDVYKQKRRSNRDEYLQYILRKHGLTKLIAWGETINLK